MIEENTATQTMVFAPFEALVAIGSVGPCWFLDPLYPPQRIGSCMRTAWMTLAKNLPQGVGQVYMEPCSHLHFSYSNVQEFDH